MMMHTSSKLLEQARQMIGASQFQNAEMVLDALIRVDPKNVEAWKAYLWVRRTQAGLEWVKDRALKTRELSESGKREIFNFYLDLTGQMSDDWQASLHTDVCALELQTEERCVAGDSAVRFELLDTFDYSTRPGRRDVRPKPRRAAYNFAGEITGGIIGSMARRPLGQKIVAYGRQVSGLLSQTIDSPAQAYARFSESPHFEKTSGIAVLALVLLGARLAIAGYWLGYAGLGVSVLLIKWWLSKFWTPGIVSFAAQTRAYLQESEDKTPQIAENSKEQPGDNSV